MTMTAPTLELASVDNTPLMNLDQQVARLVVEDFEPDDVVTRVAFAGCINDGMTIEQLASAIEQDPALVADVLLDVPMLIDENRRSEVVRQCLVLRNHYSLANPASENR